MAVESTAEPCLVCGQSWALSPSWMCGGCFRRLDRDLAQAVWAHGWLGAKMTSLRPAWRTGTIGRDGEPQPPYDVQITDVRNAIQATLVEWSKRIAYEHIPVLVGPADHTVAALGRWLRAHSHWASDQPWCNQYAYDLAKARSDAYKLAPWDRAREDLALPCPRCGAQSLTYYQGSDGVTCSRRGCSHTMAWSDYLGLIAEWRRRNTKPSRAAAAA
jgi:hypothetical protein